MIIRIVVGIIFIALGIAGSLLPVLQGWLFFLIALIVLFPNHPRIRRWLDHIEARHPRTFSWMHRLHIVPPEHSRRTMTDPENSSERPPL